MKRRRNTTGLVIVIFVLSLLVGFMLSGLLKESANHAIDVAAASQAQPNSVMDLIETSSELSANKSVNWIVFILICFSGIGITIALLMAFTPFLKQINSFARSILKQLKRPVGRQYTNTPIRPVQPVSPLQSGNDTRFLVDNSQAGSDSSWLE